MSAAHAEAHSVRARCQATTCPSATAMSTTAFLRSQIPSRKTTSCTSPVKGAIGHILHIQAVFLQNVVLLTLRSAIASLESSHRKNDPSAFAALSCLPNARCAALRAAPASRPCFGRSVALHLGTARATRRSVHSRFLFLDNFSVEKPSLTRPVKRKTDTLSETSGNWCGAISKAYFP